MNKSFNTTWSDDGEEEDNPEQGQGIVSNVTILCTVLNCLTTNTLELVELDNEGKALFQHDNSNLSDSNLSDDEIDLTMDEVRNMFKELYSNWLKVCKVNKSLESQISKYNVLEQKLIKKENEVDCLKTELQKVKDEKSQLITSSGQKD